MTFGNHQRICQGNQDKKYRHLTSLIWVSGLIFTKTVRYVFKENVQIIYNKEKCA
jgi:hypothetical protein